MTASLSIHFCTESEVDDLVLKYFRGRQHLLAAYAGPGSRHYDVAEHRSTWHAFIRSHVNPSSKLLSGINPEFEYGDPIYHYNHTKGEIVTGTYLGKTRHNAIRIAPDSSDAPMTLPAYAVHSAYCESYNWNQKPLQHFEYACMYMHREMCLIQPFSEETLEALIRYGSSVTRYTKTTSAIVYGARDERVIGDVTMLDFSYFLEEMSP